MLFENVGHMFGVCTFLVYDVVLYVAGREACGIMSQERSDKVEFYMQRAHPAFQRQLCFYDLLKLTKLINKTKNNIRGVPILLGGELAEDVLKIIDKSL